MLSFLICNRKRLPNYNEWNTLIIFQFVFFSPHAGNLNAKMEKLQSMISRRDFADLFYKSNLRRPEPN